MSDIKKKLHQIELDKELTLEKEYAPIKMDFNKMEFKFRFGEIIDKNIEQLKLLNEHIFKLNLNDEFYNKILELGPLYNYFSKNFFILFFFF